MPPRGSLLDGHVGWPCSRMFTVAVLNAILDLAALVLVGVAAFFGSEVVLGSLHVEVIVSWCGRLLGLWTGLGSLWLPLAPFGSLHVRCERKNERMTIYCCGRAFAQRASKWSRCLRAASAESTRAYAVEPRQIPRNHLSYSYRFVCITSCTYSSNYICTYMRRQASWQFTYSFTSKNANEHLPTQLCLRHKNLHCFRGCLRTPPRTVKYQVVSLRDFIRSSLEYIMPCIQKKTM